jgi:hypothetical protein
MGNGQNDQSENGAGEKRARVGSLLGVANLGRLTYKYYRSSDQELAILLRQMQAASLCVV